MSLEEIKKLLRSLKDVKEDEWLLGGTIRYETTVDGKKIIIDRRNNADEETSECYLRVGKFEQVFREGTKEYELLSNFVLFLDTNE